MYPSQLLTTLSLLALPLTILSAPAELKPRQGPAVYYIMRTSTNSLSALLPTLEGNGVSKSFSATVKGDGPGAVDVICTGNLRWEGNAEALGTQQTAGLACTDGMVRVFVTTAGTDAGETYSVQDRDLPAATTTIQPSCSDRTGTTVCSFMGPARLQSA